MESHEDREKQWLALPVGEVLAWLENKAETLWDESVNAPLQGKEKAAAEWERVASLHNRLARVVAWLAGMQPPQAVCEPSQSPEEGFVGKRQRARGRVCFVCRRQIRRTADLMVVSPVRIPGLPVHEKCFGKIEEEFGGKQ